MKRMSVKEYAEKREITPGAVRKAIYQQNKMPGVNNYEKFGRDYILYVDENQVFTAKPKKTLKKV